MNSTAAATRPDPFRLIGPDEESAALAARLDEWGQVHAPESAYAEWVLARLVQATVRLDRNLAHESAVRSYEAVRAETCWDDDRRLEAEDLGAKIQKNPARVRRQLESTRQGADWLIERWDALGRIAGSGREWSEPQKAMALDMLGTPPALRDGPAPFDPAPSRPEPAAAAQASVASAELQRLSLLRERVLAPCDEHERALASSGVSVRPSPAMLRLQREEAFWTREYRRADAEFRRTRSRPNDPPAPAPNPRVSPPAPRPEPEPDSEPVARPDADPVDFAALDRMILSQLMQARQNFGISEPLEAVDLTQAAVATPAFEGNRHARRVHEARMRSQK